MKLERVEKELCLNKFPLFVLIFYVSVNNFSFISGWVFLDRTSTKQRIKCLVQRHNAVPPVRLEPSTLDLETE